MLAESGKQYLHKSWHVVSCTMHAVCTAILYTAKSVAIWTVRTKVQLTSVYHISDGDLHASSSIRLPHINEYEGNYVSKETGSAICAWPDWRRTVKIAYAAPGRVSCGQKMKVSLPRYLVNDAPILTAGSRLPAWLSHDRPRLPWSFTRYVTSLHTQETSAWVKLSNNKLLDFNDSFI